MSKPAKVTILCEDLQQACFVRRFLMNRGWTRYDLYERTAPAGSGSGEQWVRERLPLEMRAYRSQCNHLRNGLVAVIDADSLEVVDRVRGFDTACDEQGVAPRQPDERVLYVIPKRNIETWLAYLRGEPSVDEQTHYRGYEYESACHRDVDRLDAMCRKGQLEGEPPASLERCCREFQDFWRLIQ
jgi:hypothetical protein